MKNMIKSLCKFDDVNNPYNVLNIEKEETESEIFYSIKLNKNSPDEIYINLCNDLNNMNFRQNVKIKQYSDKIIISYKKDWSNKNIEDYNIIDKYILENDLPFIIDNDKSLLHKSFLYLVYIDELDTITEEEINSFFDYINTKLKYNIEYDDNVIYLIPLDCKKDKIKNILEKRKK